MEHFGWKSVFLVPVPLAVVALIMAVMLVPAHVNETTDPVDNIGGVLSVMLVAALVLAINFAAVPGRGSMALGLGLLALLAGIGFVLRQRRAAVTAVRPAHRGPADLLGRRDRRASSSSAR